VTKNTTNVAIIYVLLATGTVTAYEYIKEWSVVYFLFLGLIIYVLCSSRAKCLQTKRLLLVLKYLTPFILYYCIASIWAHDGEMLLRRIEGAFIVTTLVGLMISYGIEKEGEETFFKNFIKVAACVLLCTVIYKINYGVFDRDVRFFLNGPIVFSWLMCFSAICVMYFLINGGFSDKYLILFFVFVGAAIWSASKGPLIALMVVLAKLFYDAKFNSKTRKYFIILLGSLILLLILSPLYLFHRLSGVTRLMNTDDRVEDYGSIGIRYEMWASAWSIFKDNPLFGVGPTNWKLHSEFGDLLYPHNIALEILSEIGVVGTMLAFMTIVFIWIRTTALGKLSILFFVICSSFSGDISYLRMILGFSVGMAVYKDLANRPYLSKHMKLKAASLA